MADRFVCIHGHFYQPPRENPWLEEVEFQDSAYPYHDWNARITEECYRPNAASRILGSDRKIIDIVNNYARISFNFGPTLLSWLDRREPQVYDAILDADKLSQETFHGHGAAVAQAYNHIIMPLANTRDKRTQILWGLYDFQSRFGRDPEGMWLPETAVDLETLDLLAEQGIRFTVLSPTQAARMRRVGQRNWTEVTGEGIDTTQAYICHLPSGRTIALFFYHGPTAQGVASGRFLQNGDVLAERLLSVLQDSRNDAPLAHVATDGETFGHHHRFTDMALAYCLHQLQAKHIAEVTIYGDYLERFPPTHEVEVVGNTSWSCPHGVERWRDNCGCHFGTSPSGRQAWRKPLRQAMDGLRDALSGIYERRLLEYCPDPWAVRDDYIVVINDRSSGNVERFLRHYAGRHLDDADKIQVLKLLEMQRNALLMYTSCGWFFDDISGIETVQCMLYAARAIQLAKDLEGKDLEGEFEKVLEQAQCNASEYDNGKEVYEVLVRPHCIDLNRVGAHLAISSIFEPEPEKMDLYCYRADIEAYDRDEAGLQVLATGRATVTSRIVLERHAVDFAVLHLGDRNLIGAVTPRMSDGAFSSLQKDLRQAFDKGDTTEMLRLMHLSFGGNNYSLWHLFKDQQRHILDDLLASTWQSIELAYRQIYERNYTIIQLMRGMKMPPRDKSFGGKPI